MKKYLSRLFVLLFTVALIIPTFVFAEGDEDKDSETKKDPVVVYLFRGEGCPHCEEALEWFNSEEVQKEYGDYFKIESYEVWEDENNAALMDAVASYKNEEASGVPYILIGDHTYSGFDSNDTDTIIGYIMEEYKKDEKDRIQVVPKVIEETGWTGEGDVSSESSEKDNSNSDIIVGIVSVVIIVAIILIIVKARKED